MLEIKRFTSSPPEGLVIQRDGKQRKIRGLASVYYDGSSGSEYQLGDNLFERIAPGAWQGRTADDVSARINHDPRLTVGRTPKTLSIWTTQRGLEYEITLPDTSKANDLWEEVSNDIIRGSSFYAFIDPDDESAIEYKREGDKRIMIIKRFSLLVDVAPVNSPAYTATETTAIVRGFESWEARQRTNQAIERLASLNKILNCKHT